MKKLLVILITLVLVSPVALMPATQVQAADTLTKTNTLAPEVEDPPGVGGQVTYLECASTFTGCASTFTGIVKVWGLDPGIRYQLKLDGMPTCLHGKEGDDWSSKAIGLQGRWWKTDPLPEENIYDDEWWLTHPDARGKHLR